MKRVTGIGGIFFKAKDAPAMLAWYKRHLGIDVTEWGGATFSWSDAEGIFARGHSLGKDPYPPAHPCDPASFDRS